MEDKDKIILAAAGAGVTIVVGKVLNNAYKSVRVELAKRKRIKQIQGATRNITTHLQKRIQSPDYTEEGFLDEAQQEMTFLDIIAHQPLN